MAGIVNNQMAEREAITPQSVRQQMHLPQQLQPQLDRVVAAGLKVMFDPQTHKLMLDQLKQPGDLSKKVGEGIAGLLVMLFQESKQAMPPQLMVPAGMVLVAEAAQWLNKAGESMPNVEIAQAMQVMVGKLLSAFGLDGDKLAARGEQGAQKLQAQQAPQEPPVPEDQEAPAGEAAEPAAEQAAEPDEEVQQ